MGEGVKISEEFVDVVYVWSPISRSHEESSWMQKRHLAFAGPFGGSSSTSANDFYVSMFSNTIDYGIPASISVLINFGLNDKHIQYSADNLAHGCDLKQVPMTL